jgi:holliday junction DNA helicase RuvB
MAKMEPQALSQVLGQPELVEVLTELVETSHQRGHPLPAVMVVGPAETGKRAITTALAAELIASGDKSVRSVDAAAIPDPEGMRDVVYGLSNNAVLRINGVHRLSLDAYEVLGKVVREFEMADDSAHAGGDVRRDLELGLFSVIATSETDLGQSGPSIEEQVARDWISLRVVPYEFEALVEIAHRSAKRLDLKVTDGAAEELVRRSAGLPGRLQKVIATVVASWGGDYSGAVIDLETLSRTGQ